VIQVGLAEIADRISMEPDGWFVVVVDDARIMAITATLREELASQLEEEEGRGVDVVANVGRGAAAVMALSRFRAEDVVILPLLAEEAVEVARALDFWRTRLHGPVGVIVTSNEGVQAIAREAPSFWSWIGPRAFKIDEDVGRLDAETRLASLRQGTGLTDQAILERAQAGTLPADPVFAEWLSLLGKGRLLGN
jgi:hypothetical protein